MSMWDGLCAAVNDSRLYWRYRTAANVLLQTGVSPDGMSAQPGWYVPHLANVPPRAQPQPVEIDPDDVEAAELRDKLGAATALLHSAQTENDRLRELLAHERDVAAARLQEIDRLRTRLVEQQELQEQIDDARKVNNHLAAEFDRLKQKLGEMAGANLELHERNNRLARQIDRVREAVAVGAKD